jgi:hypothetical protein
MDVCSAFETMVHLSDKAMLRKIIYLEIHMLQISCKSNLKTIVCIFPGLSTRGRTTFRGEIFRRSTVYPERFISTWYLYKGTLFPQLLYSSSLNFAILTSLSPPHTTATTIFYHFLHSPCGVIQLLDCPPECTSGYFVKPWLRGLMFQRP